MQFSSLGVVQLLSFIPDGLNSLSAILVMLKILKMTFTDMHLAAVLLEVECILSNI